MWERPEFTSLDRIDNNKWYSPDNCRWVNQYIQVSNSRIVKWVAWVYYNKQRNKWHSSINIWWVHKHIWYYDNYDDAVRNRKEAEVPYL